MKLKLYILHFFILSAIASYSQEINCVTCIKDAEELYKNGNYESAVQIINSALKNCSLSKREKEDAYILLAQSHLEKENYTEANKLIIKILNNDPNFNLKENLYQEDFYAYYNRIKIRPLLSAGLMTGVNFQKYSQKETYSILDSADYTAPYKSKTGYQYGIFAEYQFYHNISLLASGAFSKIGYDRTISSSDNHKTNINYSEQLKNTDVSLVLKKYFLQKQIKPFISIGGYYTNLRKATASAGLTYDLKDKITPDIDNYELSKNNIDVLPMRNKNRQGILIGGGVSYKTNNFLISADADYKVDIGKHLTNSNNRFKNDDLLFKYYYVDNDVNLSRLNVSVSVAYILKYSIKSK